ncbi:GerAB/ArcD/ProY family transporter [Paenibacillus sp. NFR01]|uniref:GerAB/ArcD/ProY family transporter n=1 Tax=Paenibacillus sp. NFR01 TaxID=1566279 RepID=UPI0008CF6348|nr:GerAB/ArcD/ProY family transporter [Paenibacillus sp. NFR01]SET18177.1 Spore germination protein [Paenibacillus sp. NFR01]
MHVASKWQIYRFSMVYYSSQTSIFLIPLAVEHAGYQGWLTLSGGALIGAGLLYLSMKLGELGEGRSWIDFGADIMGKWPHRIFAFILMLWCVYYTSYDIENFVLFFGSNYMRGTPPMFIQLILAVIISYTATRGLSTILYLADGIFMILLASIAICGYLFTVNANFHMIPAFIHYHDPKVIATGAFADGSWYGEWMVFLFIAPVLKITPKMQRKLMIAEATLLLLLIFGWGMTILNFGPHLGAKLQYPYLDMVRSSSHDDIIGNLDLFLIAIWSFSMFIHSSFLICTASVCLVSVFSKSSAKSKKWMTIPLVCIATGIAYFYSARNVSNYYNDFHSLASINYWYVVELIPLYYLTVYWIRFKLFKQRMPSPNHA